MKYLPYGHQSIDEKDIKEVLSVLRSDRITQGPRINKFEKSLCLYTGAKYAVAVSSGTAALHIACLAAGIKSGDEVITSPITFVASANCIVYCGGKPIFADILEDTVNINPEEIKKNITNHTKGIIPVHFAGHPCDLDKIHKVAKEYKLCVIEDATHALGAKYKDSKIGSCRYSDLTIFSFHPVKHITTGEGGAITTNKPDLYEKLLSLRNHGILKEKKKLTRWDGPWYYEQHSLGFNYRITDFQCALGLSQIKKIDQFIKKRRKIADIYFEEFSNFPGIKLPAERKEVNSSWHIYCLRINDHDMRNKLFDHLRSTHIGAQIHYIPVHLQPYYKKNFGYRDHDFEQAENYYKQTITIPLYPTMKKEEVMFVVKTIKRFLQ